VVIMVQQPIIM